MAVKFDNEALINEVHKRVGLWDRNDRCHYNMVVIGKLWDEISEEMNVPVPLIRKKWRNLRDQFRIQYKKILPNLSDKNNIEDMKSLSNWYYFDMLLFLADQIGVKPNKSKKTNTIEKSSKILNEIKNEPNDIKVETSNVEIDITESHFESLDDELYEDYNNEDEEDEEEEEPVPPKRRTTERIFEKMEIKRQKQNPLEKDASLIETTRYEDEAFFHSLVPHLEQLEPRQKLLCRIEIQKLIFQHAYGNEHKNSK